MRELANRSSPGKTARKVFFVVVATHCIDQSEIWHSTQSSILLDQCRSEV